MLEWATSTSEQRILLFDGLNSREEILQNLKLATENGTSAHDMERSFNSWDYERGRE